MKLDEYIALAKQELDEFEVYYKGESEKDPENWPLEFDLAEWGEQELAYRFS